MHPGFELKISLFLSF